MHSKPFTSVTLNSQKSQKILWVREHFQWMGNHSGYDQLYNYLSNQLQTGHISIFRTNYNFNKVQKRILNKVLMRIKKSDTYDLNSMFTEIRALIKMICLPRKITHVLYIERSLSLIPKMPRKFKGFLIGTAHQPPSLWERGRHRKTLVKDLDALIVLNRESQDYFESVLPGKVHYIPHGIDTSFFRPDDSNTQKKVTGESPRCVFAGTWLRDVNTLAQVIRLVNNHNKSIQFDILIPLATQREFLFESLKKFTQVHWYTNLSDEQLRTLYQKATLFLLPIHDCTANNAVLEAMACGLPIVSNDVGGIRDYCDERFARLLPVGDVNGMVESILELIQNKYDCIVKGKYARSHAKKHFAWELIGRDTNNLYNKLIS